MTIETILNSDMSVAYITDCATSPVKRHQSCHAPPVLSILRTAQSVK
jgi:hypothetical protein